MRIIAGSLRSRKLEAPRSLGASFLDLYSGSGAVGIEALSRGAARIVFVERVEPALAALRENLARLGLREGARVHAGSVSAFLRRGRPESSPRFDLVFLDPPYDAAPEYEASLGLLGGASSSLLAPGALVVAEHRRKEPLEEGYGELRRTRLLQQGDAALSFYTKDIDPPSR